MRCNLYLAVHKNVYGIRSSLETTFTFITFLLMVISLQCSARMHKCTTSSSLAIIGNVHKIDIDLNIDYEITGCVDNQNSSHWKEFLVCFFFFSKNNCSNLIQGWLISWPIQHQTDYLFLKSMESNGKQIVLNLYNTYLRHFIWHHNWWFTKHTDSMLLHYDVFAIFDLFPPCVCNEMIASLIIPQLVVVQSMRFGWAFVLTICCWLFVCLPGRIESSLFSIFSSFLFIYFFFIFITKVT